MNVTDILAYKPDKSVKRKAMSEEEQSGTRPAKKSLKIKSARKLEATKKLITEGKLKELEEGENEGAGFNHVCGEELAETVESNEESCDVEDASLRKLVLLLQKRFSKNQELRMKFAEQPERFLESELDLYDVIEEMRSVVTLPRLYEVLLLSGATVTLLELLTHVNSDVTIAVLDLLQELTDVDGEEEQVGAAGLAEVLLQHQVVTLLVDCVERLEDEAQGVSCCLAVLENLLDFRPELDGAPHEDLVLWLLRRLRVKVAFDDVKLHASELLSILLQNSSGNCAVVGELGGIDVLLQQLALYKRQDPSSSEEREMMENVFDCMCCVLLHPPNRPVFLQGEGLQLMNLMLKERRVSRGGALRVLDHALSGPGGRENCNKFVDILGLRTVFPLLMKPPRRSRVNATSLEEHVISIVCSLLRHCEGLQRSRLLNKFTENDLEKVDRLVELHFAYLEKLEGVEETGDEEEVYHRRLEAGLFTLQQVDYMLLEVCCRGFGQAKQRVLKLINQRAGSLKVIKHIMREYAGNLGDCDLTAKHLERQHIIQLIDKF